jgi:DNA-binding transcriptional LysR family regulator
VLHNDRVTELVDFKLLQLFDVLYDTRSVTKAADQLRLSQPTASIWLGQLRRELRDPLFVRTPGGMVPTPRATTLIGPCREVLESLRRLTAWEATFDPATAQRRFRISMTDASHVTLLPRLLAELRAKAPRARLDAVGIDGNTERALESGESDLAIGYLPGLAGGIRQEKLYDQDWVCLANPQHPRVRDRLDAHRYRAEDHVIITAGTGTQLLDRGLAQHRVERRVVLELPGILGLGAIIQSTDLLATLPRHIGTTLARTNGLGLFPCPIPIEGFVVAQHWHARFHDEPGNRWLRALVTRLFARRD